VTSQSLPPKLWRLKELRLSLYVLHFRKITRVVPMLMWGIKADLNNENSLKVAIKGAYAVYAVTNYWESRSADVEMKQGKAMADAAKVCRLSECDMNCD